jgi:uncharacterized protein YyaL (SSP411 family)
MLLVHHSSLALIQTAARRSCRCLLLACNAQSFDNELGGFGDGSRGIKFPQPTRLELLLTAAYALPNRLGASDEDRAQGGKALHMAVKTLDCMARGGINDHIEGGFARYSTDRRWHVPHFEKVPEPCLCIGASLPCTLLSIQCRIG